MLTTTSASRPGRAGRRGLWVCVMVWRAWWKMRAYSKFDVPRSQRCRLISRWARRLGFCHRRIVASRDKVFLSVSLNPGVVSVRRINLEDLDYNALAATGYRKGRSAIHIARAIFGKRRSFVGQSFWARGYFVSTVGRDEAMIRRYIQHQEVEDRRLEQLRFDSM